MIEKAILGSVRLDSDVWEAVRAMPESLNIYLRRELVDVRLVTAEELARIERNVTPCKQSKRAKAVTELAASDITAQKVGRDDIDYANSETLPRGQHVTNLDAVANPAGSIKGKASVETWRKDRKPLLKPKERK